MKIEIWSDVVCPWCYIGKRRMEEALAKFPHDVDVAWRSFELDPAASAEPMEALNEALAAKYGLAVEAAREMMVHMASTGADAGLELNFDMARGGNTLDAHRLLHFASTRNAQDRMKERLFRAYMTEGRPISRREELGLLAGEVGLDPAEVRAMLETDAFELEVRQDEARALELGIRGVPYFLIDERIAVSGAQPSHVLLGAFHQAAAQALQGGPIHRLEG